MTAAPKIPADETLRSLLKGHLDDHDLIANLGSFARRMHFMKAFAHYEVFKLIQDLPGDIVECGVYKGSSLLSFARFLETFCPGDRTRKVLGFDHFRGLADRTDKDGLDDRVGNTAEGWNPGAFRDTLFALVDAFNADAFVTVRPRIELVDGDVCQTGHADQPAAPGHGPLRADPGGVEGLLAAHPDRRRGAVRRVRDPRMAGRDGSGGRVLRRQAAPHRQVPLGVGPGRVFREGLSGR